MVRPGAWVYAVLFFRGYVWSVKLKRGLSAYLPPPGAQPTWEVVTKDIGGIKVPTEADPAGDTLGVR